MQGGKCSQCIWWGKEIEHTGVPDWRECLHPDPIFRACAENGDVWGKVSGVLTSPDFCCRLFEDND
jgi:hypothetical protein